MSSRATRKLQIQQDRITVLTKTLKEAQSKLEEAGDLLAVEKIEDVFVSDNGKGHEYETA